MKFKARGLIMALLFFLFFATEAFAMPFSDVDKDAVYADAIEYVNGAGIMVGRDTGEFDPNGCVTRGEMAAVICRLLKVDTKHLAGRSNFLDCRGHWAESYVAKAAEQGIVNGYGNGNFGPDDTVTYEQAITMVVRAIGYEPQAKRAGAYPQGYLSIAESQGLLYKVNSMLGINFTRAEIAQVLYNSENLTGESSISSDYENDTIKRLKTGEYWDTENDNLSISAIHSNGTIEFSVGWYRLAGFGPATARLEGKRASFDYHENGLSVSGYIDFLREDAAALTITDSNNAYISEVKYTVFEFVTDEELDTWAEDTLQSTLLRNTNEVGWIQSPYDHGPIFGDLPDSFLRFFPDGTVKYWLVEPDSDGPSIYEHQGSYTVQKSILTIADCRYSTIIDHGATDYLYLQALGDDPYHFADRAFSLETHDFYVWLNQSGQDLR